MKHDHRPEGLYRVAVIICLAISICFVSLFAKGQSVIPMGSLSGNSINTVSGGISAAKGLQPPMKLTTWVNAKWNLCNIFFDSGYSYKLVYYNGSVYDTFASQRWVLARLAAGTDSSVFATVYDVDTAKVNIRTALADSCDSIRTAITNNVPVLPSTQVCCRPSATVAAV